MAKYRVRRVPTGYCAERRQWDEWAGLFGWLVWHHLDKYDDKVYATILEAKEAIEANARKLYREELKARLIADFKPIILETRVSYASLADLQAGKEPDVRVVDV